MTTQQPAGGLFFSASDSPSNHDATPAISRALAERPAAAASTMVLFQEPDISRATQARRARRHDPSPAVDSSADDTGNSTRGASPGGNHDALEESVPSGSAKRSRRGTRGGRKGLDKTDPENEGVGVEDSADADNQHANSAASRKRIRARAAHAASSDNPADINEEASGVSDEYTDGDSDASAAEENKTPNKRSKKSRSDAPSDDAVASAVTVRKRRRRVNEHEEAVEQVSAPKGSTRLEAKKQRRKEEREAGRRRHTITESEFLARRESVNRDMLVRERDGLNQIAVIEDGVLVEHYVARHTQSSMVGNVYLGRVQNVLPSMEAAFVDIGKGRNAVLYAGEVNWDAAGLEGKPRRIEEALKSGDTVLVQVTKDPIGHKGARLTSQITLAGRHLVLVPNGAMMGISRKLPEKERARLKKILKDIVPAEHGVIVRTAAEGASEEQLRNDVDRLSNAWKDIEGKSKSSKNAPSLLKGEPELAVRVVRDVFNEDFASLKVQGDNTWETISEYVKELSPELVERVSKWDASEDIFQAARVDEQLAKAFDRKVYLPSGGSLVIDRTEAMTVIDVNTGKFVGSGGSLEETVTQNNLEAAEEIVRQLRLRDIGGIVVIDFIDMVLEANRDLVLRRLIECLGRDRTRHQVAEVTSLGLVQMTRKRVGQGLVEAFSTVCECCEGRGYITYDHPIEKDENPAADSMVIGGAASARHELPEPDPEAEAKQAEVKAALNSIAAAAANKHKNKSAKNQARANEKKQGTIPPLSVKEPEILGDTGEEPAEFELKPAKKTASRVVTSSGTITPATSAPASSFIMSFPKK